MAAAHLAVESHCADIEKCQKEFKKGKSIKGEKCINFKIQKTESINRRSIHRAETSPRRNS